MKTDTRWQCKQFIDFYISCYAIFQDIMYIDTNTKQIKTLVFREIFSHYLFQKESEIENQSITRAIKTKLNKDEFRKLPQRKKSFYI